MQGFSLGTHLFYPQTLPSQPFCPKILVLQIYRLMEEDFQLSSPQ